MCDYVLQTPGIKYLRVKATLVLLLPFDSNGLIKLPRTQLTQPNENTQEVTRRTLEELTKQLRERFDGIEGGLKGPSPAMSAFKYGPHVYTTHV